MGTRLNDMLEKYGEVCTQVKAAKILGVAPRTVARMLTEQRLHRVGAHVDVRSICDYIENPQQISFNAQVRKKYPKNLMNPDDFLAASIHRGL